SHHLQRLRKNRRVRERQNREARKRDHPASRFFHQDATPANHRQLRGVKKTRGMQEEDGMLKVRGALSLVALAVLLTGCPRNQYFVDLTPRGNVIERTLVFYCEDGMDTNGVPNYKDFPTNELLEVARLYPANALKNDGERHTVSGRFGPAMP